MPIDRMGRGVDFSPSRAVNILNTVLGLIEDKQNTNQFLQHISFSGGFYKTLPADVPDNSLYVSIESIPLSVPKSLGQRNVTYDEAYVVSLFYYNCAVDKGDDAEYLLLTLEMLKEFFIEHSGLNGLCNYGVQVHSPRIVMLPHGNNFYNGVAVDLLVRVVTVKNRVPLP